jgi:hypothetical protein
MSYSSHALGAGEQAKGSLTSSPIPLVSRRLLAALMATSGLLIAGFIGYSLLKKNGQRNASEPPPIIQADSTPVKVAPQASAGTDEPNRQDMRIYEKMNSNLSGQENSFDHTADSIIRKDESPLLETGDQLTFQQLAQEQGGLSAHSETQAGFPPPKQVKTVVMRPDGTIISQGVKTENYSEQPLSSEKKSISSLTGEKKVSRKVVSVVPEETQDANATQKIPSAKVTDGAPNAGRGFSVQLAATGSEKEALVFFETLKRRYGVLSEKTPTIYKVNLAGKMVYRLRVKTASQEESASLCQAIQAQGGSCFVARN